MSPDAPAALDFHARRSLIFLAATYDPTASQAKGLTVGDGTPVQISIPLANPWVPLRILALGKDPDDVVQADVFLLTDHGPSVLTGPGVSLTRSEPASPSLLNDLRSDHGMGWVPDTGWLSYLKVQAPSAQLRYEMAIDASGVGHPSAVAADPECPPLPPPPLQELDRMGRRRGRCACHGSGRLRRSRRPQEAQAPLLVHPARFTSVGVHVEEPTTPIADWQLQPWAKRTRADPDEVRTDSTVAHQGGCARSAGPPWQRIKRHPTPA